MPRLPCRVGRIAWRARLASAATICVLAAYAGVTPAAAGAFCHAPGPATTTRPALLISGPAWRPPTPPLIVRAFDGVLDAMDESFWRDALHSAAA